MPYIKNQDRAKFDSYLDSLNPETAGELNYCITSLVQGWLRSKGICYESLNSSVGVLTCVQQEFYRRCVSSYEDTKIVTNGDVRKDLSKF